MALWTSPTLLAELRGVLERPDFVARLERQVNTVERAVEQYELLTSVVTPTEVPHVVSGDADDDHGVAAAVAASEALVVSGDKRLLSLGSHQGIRIVTPRTALLIMSGR